MCKPDKKIPVHSTQIMKKYRSYEYVFYQFNITTESLLYWRKRHSQYMLLQDFLMEKWFPLKSISLFKVSLVHQTEENHTLRKWALRLLNMNHQSPFLHRPPYHEYNNFNHWVPHTYFITINTIQDQSTHWSKVTAMTNQKWIKFFFTPNKLSFF